MIVTQVGNEVFHVITARLKHPNGSPIRFFNTAGQIIAYLKANPDQDFLLEGYTLGQPLQGAAIAHYTPASGDMICGQVKFDTAANAVVCS